MNFLFWQTPKSVAPVPVEPPAWIAPEWLACPHCHIGYQCTHVGVTFDRERQYTIVCLSRHCGKSFNVDVSPQTLKVTAR